MGRPESWWLGKNQMDRPCSRQKYGSSMLPGITLPTYHTGNVASHIYHTLLPQLTQPPHWYVYLDIWIFLSIRALLRLMPSYALPGLILHSVSVLTYQSQVGLSILPCSCLLHQLALPAVRRERTRS